MFWKLSRKQRHTKNNEKLGDPDMNDTEKLGTVIKITGGQKSEDSRAEVSAPG